MSEIEELMDLLHDIGIEVVDEHENDLAEGDVVAPEEEEEYEKTEDIVQTYFHSMGNITILKRNEEIELAKSLEEGKEIFKGIVTALPLYKEIEANLDGTDEEDLNNSEGEKADEALEMSLEALDNLMIKVELADTKIARYGTLKKLKKTINKDVPQIGYSAHLVVACDLPEDMVYTMLKTLAANVDSLASINKPMAGLTPKMMAEDIGVPFHTGAIRFYKEAKAM